MIGMAAIPAGLRFGNDNGANQPFIVTGSISASSPYLIEQLTGEIIFAHLTASTCPCIVLPKSDHQSGHFFPKTNDTKLVFDCTKQLLMIDQHPSILFQELEADLFFRFSFN